jgi:hypothetical protein
LSPNSLVGLEAHGGPWPYGYNGPTPELAREGWLTEALLEGEEPRPNPKISEWIRSPSCLLPAYINLAVAVNFHLGAAHFYFFRGKTGAGGTEEKLFTRCENLSSFTQLLVVDSDS